MNHSLSGKSVIIMTPARHFTVSYVKSLIDTLSWCFQNDIICKLVTLDGSHVAQLRQAMTHGLKEADESFDYAFWIDSDVSWNVKDFETLLSSPYDITCGLYLITEDGGISVHKTAESVNKHSGVLMKHSELNKYRRYFEVGCSGFGFICLKNNVIDSMHPDWFMSRTAINTYKNGDTEEIMISGEDIAWCYCARDAGYKVMCDATVLVGHEKSSVWKIPR